MKSVSEMRAHLIEKAEMDEAFRTRLVADPKTVVSEEFGVKVPEGFSMTVHEETADSAHLVLPPSPRLSDEALTQVTGGARFIWN